ncbi:MAG: recombinase family protein [Chloroflexi bacterium]|jgi:DNA invertase Pin-like site-specific DNA recombinase|nr:recombinase family protein [Thiotrichales bacterium]MBT7081025.1 recombinase family protein [Chloroflexota bacterium]
MSNVGYIRVSSIGQNTDRQLDGVALDEVFEEKASAATTNRPKLQECIRFLRKGDTLHVHSLDRLARSLADLEGLVKQISDKGAVVHFHKESLIFSGEDSAISMMMLQILGAVAQFERALIRERQQEGIEKAKTKGKYKGRKKALSDDQVKELKRRIAAGETKSAVAAAFGVSRQTLYQYLR